VPRSHRSPTSFRPRRRARPQRHGAQWSAVGLGRRRDRSDGCAGHRVGDRRRVRLGGAVGQCRRRPVASPVQGDGVGERLPDRQSGGEYGTVAATGRALVVVPVLFRHRTRRAGYDRYRRDFAKLICTPRHRSGTFDHETFERSAASFDNVDHVDIVTHNYRWRLGLTLGESQYDLEKQPQRVRSSRCQPSPSKVTPTVPLTRTRAHTRRSSRGSTRTGPSPAASDTTCPKKCPSGRPSRHGHRQILVLTTSRGDPWPDRVERTCATVVRLTNGASRVPVVTAVREPPG
jgi:hypothetical protein